MSEAEDPRLALEVGGRRVGENLDRAIERGGVLRDEDGRLSLRHGGRTDTIGRGHGFIMKHGARRLGCQFLNAFLFEQVYARAAVPFGCRACFKIKVSTRSLRALVAMKEIAEATEHPTKSGAAVDQAENPDLFCTYIYFHGLDAARAAYAPIRAAVDGHPHLGEGVAMQIKRGCTNYERALGPSDRYAFDPRLEALEAELAERFVETAPPADTSKAAGDALRMLNLVRIAYRIGDETYLDFTDGKPLLAPLVSYPPAADAPLEGGAAPGPLANGG